MRTSRPFFEISRAHPDRSWFTLKKENEELTCIVVCIPAFASFSEAMMKTLRWLLPFMHGVDMRAIDSVVNLAASTRATLVAVSLISVPDKSRSGGARLELIQQSKDFLEAVKWKAARYSVLIERYEVFTGNVLQSLTPLAHDQECESIVLVTAEKRDMLLPALEMKHLLEDPP